MRVDAGKVFPEKRKILPYGKNRIMCQWIKNFCLLKPNMLEKYGEVLKKPGIIRIFADMLRERR